MRPVMQTRLHLQGEPPGNCYAAAIASLLEVPIEEVPWPGEENRGDWGTYWPRVARYLDSKGVVLIHVPYSDEEEDSGIAPHIRPWTTRDELGQPGPYYIANGLGPRGNQHSVVMRDGKLEHDPHPEGGGLLRLRSIEFLLPVRACS